MAGLSPEDILEIEADRHRRVTTAFRLGSEASPRAGPTSAGQLAAGTAIAIAVALILGVVALVPLSRSATTTGGGVRSPAPVVTPARSP